MWITERLRGERRQLTPQQVWGRGLDYRPASSTGMTIDLDRAMTLPVFQRCVNLYVDDIAQLPWDVYQKRGGQRVSTEAPEWMTRPTVDPNYTWTDHISDVVFSLVTDRNAFLLCTPDRFRVQNIEVIDPSDIDVKGREYYSRGGAKLDSATIVHIRAPKAPGKGRATSRVTMLSETIALGLAAEEYGGRFFANGSSMSGIVEVPAGVVVDAEQLREQMEIRHRSVSKSHAVGVLTGGATWKQTQSNARDSQLLELHESVIEDVARGFGIPPYLAGSTSPGAVAYASTSNARVDYVVHGVVGIVHRMEEAYSALIPGDETFTRASLNALLRGDQASRYTAYQTGIQSKFVTVDEVRAFEDWGPADDATGIESEHGGFLETPNNNAPGAQPPVAPAAPAERAEPVHVTVNTPPVNVTTSPVSFSVPKSEEQVDVMRAADLMVTDTREQLQMMEVSVGESSQRVADFVQTRMDQVESQMAQAETQRQADMARLAAIPAVIREVVQRDERGRPLKVVEHRGDRVIHKLVERDDDGRIIRVTEVAA